MLFLSIHPRFVEKILSGEKTYELRRRLPRSVAGDWIAIYATTPAMQLRGVARVASVCTGSVREIWQRVQSHAGVTHTEYELYFAGSGRAVGIELSHPTMLATPIALEKLREIWPGFRPPQGFCYLSLDQERYVQSLLPRSFNTLLETTKRACLQVCGC